MTYVSAASEAGREDGVSGGSALRALFGWIAGGPRRGAKGEAGSRGLLCFAAFGAGSGFGMRVRSVRAMSAKDFVPREGSALRALFGWIAGGPRRGAKGEAGSRGLLCIADFDAGSGFGMRVRSAHAISAKDFVPREGSALRALFGGIAGGAGNWMWVRAWRRSGCPLAERRLPHLPRAGHTAEPGPAPGSLSAPLPPVRGIMACPVCRQSHWHDTGLAHAHD